MRCLKNWFVYSFVPYFAFLIFVLIFCVLGLLFVDKIFFGYYG